MNAPVDPATGLPSSYSAHSSVSPTPERRVAPRDTNGVPLPVHGVGLPGQSPAQVRASQEASGLPLSHPDGYVAPATVVLKAPPKGGATVVAGLDGASGVANAGGAVAGLPGTDTVAGTDRHLAVPAGTAGLPHGVPHEDADKVRGPAVVTGHVGRPEAVEYRDGYAMEPVPASHANPSNPSGLSGSAKPMGSL